MAQRYLLGVLGGMGPLATVDFLHKLRDEEKYPDLASLTAQIALDCENARAWHAAR